MNCFFMDFTSFPTSCLIFVNHAKCLNNNVQKKVHSHSYAFFGIACVHRLVLLLLFFMINKFLLPALATHNT